MKNVKKITLSLLAAVSSIFLSSCGQSYYSRSGSKAGTCEDGGSSFFSPLQGLVSINAGIYNNGRYRGGCPPQRPHYGGYQSRPQYYGGYQSRPQYYGGYQSRPQYGSRPCPPGHGGGYPPRRAPLGSHYSNPIRSGQIEFSDSNPGGLWRH